MGERAYDGVVPLVAKPGGWGYTDVVFRHHPEILLTGDPGKSPLNDFQDKLGQAYNHTLTNRPTDFNGPKVGLRSLSVRDGKLKIDTGSTDYFTLRGIPFVASDLHQQAIGKLSTQGQTDIPIGISAHTILLAADQAVMTINTSGHGFAPGRLSLTFEGQMDPPPKDRTPFHTARRELQEELGRRVRLSDIRLLAVAAEKDSAYTSWCFVVSINTDAQSVQEAWKGVKEREASALLVAPIAELGQILLPDTQAEALQKYVIGGSLDPEKTVNPHATVPWRYDSLQDYLTSQEGA